MTFQLLPITWQTFSTIGTFLAVIVAIAYPSWHDRRRLRLQLRIGRLDDIPIPLPANVTASPRPYQQQLYTFSDPNDPNIRLEGDGVHEGKSSTVVALTITNMGRSSVVIDGWEIRFEAQEKVESKVVQEQGVRLEEVRARGKVLQLVSGEILLQMPTLTEMWVTDTIGKKWRVSKSEIRKIRAFKASLEHLTGKEKL